MKLIDKDVLVAEIEKRVGFNKTLNAYSRADECNAILSFIDTFEVKEVDLEGEIEHVRMTYFIDNDFEEATLEGRQITNIAKHFFELGLKVQKGE